jgi:hypothetical protein
MAGPYLLAPESPQVEAYAIRTTPLSTTSVDLMGFIVDCSVMSVPNGGDLSENRSMIASLPFNMARSQESWPTTELRATRPPTKVGGGHNMFTTIPHSLKTILKSGLDRRIFRSP